MKLTIFFVLAQAVLLTVGFAGFVGVFLEVWPSASTVGIRDDDLGQPSGATRSNGHLEVVAERRQPSGEHQQRTHNDLLVSQLVNRSYDRCVIMLLDALRFDMVLHGSMPSVRSIAAKDHTRLYRALARTPTVTMPRIKALTTGRLPKFIDVFHNFGNASVSEDNIIARLSQEETATAGLNFGVSAQGKSTLRRRRLVMYGDNTWLKLFPTEWTRVDGTTSFFTKDFTEVDDNVTRHLAEEFDPSLAHEKSRDWDVVVLHYLGLDHIGHQEGSSGEHMAAKQLEMDLIFQQIHENLQAQDTLRMSADPGARPSLLVLASDHGMTDAGTHGGASLQESSAVLLFAPTFAPQEPFIVRGDSVSTPILDHSTQRDGATQSVSVGTVQQIDFTPTLASLLGVGIPEHSLGRVISEVIPAMPDRLCALRKNAQQMVSVHIATLCGASVAKLTGKQNEKAVDDADGFCQELMTQYQAAERKFNEAFGLTTVNDAAMQYCFSAYDTFLSAAQEFVLGHTSSTDGGTFSQTPFLLISMGAIGIGIFALLSFSSPLLGLESVRQHGKFLTVSALVTAASATGSSFIENEHAVYYFFLTTWAALKLRDNVLALSSGQHASSSTDTVAHDSSARSSREEHHLKVSNWTDVFRWLLVIASLRQMRHRLWIINFADLNGLPDPELLPGTAVQSAVASNSTTSGFDWLVSATLLLGFALLEIAELRRSFRGCLGLHITTWHHVQNLLLGAGFAFCAFFKLCQSDVKACIALDELIFVDRNTVPRVVYACVLTTWVGAACCLFCAGRQRTERLRISERLDTEELSTAWRFGPVLAAVVLLAILLIRPTHSLTLLLAIATGLSFRKQRHCSATAFVPYHWLGRCLFYALGNSHLVSTVDVSAASVGLTSYTPLLCGSLLVFATYCGPVLAVMLFYYNYSLETDKAKQQSTTMLVYVGVQVLTVSGMHTLFTCATAAAMKQHLFVWTVFAPKLCYDAVAAILVVALVGGHTLCLWPSYHTQFKARSAAAR